MYRLSEEVRSTHSQDGAIVLDIHRGQMFCLNFVGSRIFELLKQGSAEPVIVDDISREFGIARDIAAADVREFILTLECHSLVTGNQLAESAERGIAC